MAYLTWLDHYLWMGIMTLAAVFVFAGTAKTPGSNVTGGLVCCVAWVGANAFAYYSAKGHLDGGAQSIGRMGKIDNMSLRLLGDNGVR